MVRIPQQSLPTPPPPPRPPPRLRRVRRRERTVCSAMAELNNSICRGGRPLNMETQSSVLGATPEFDARDRGGAVDRPVDAMRPFVWSLEYGLLEEWSF